MTVLFSIAALASAFLIFWVEPLFAKLVLPMLGGSPSVWNTCLMYFQTLLLLGYLYAHVSSRLLSPRRQVLVHVALVAACALALPLGLPEGWTPPGSSNVVPWLIAVLTVSLGPPFLILSATAPLLQKWLASMDPPAENPYVLYAASNAGSFLGLLAFPVLLEPALRLHEQTTLWSMTYGIAIVLLAACGLAVWRRLPADGQAASTATEEAPPPAWRERFLWIGLAFVPSSLLLGVTTYLTTDVAATPLLWVVPLSIYLLTFVIVFSRRSMGGGGPAPATHALVVTIFALVYFWQANIGFRRGYALHLGVFAFTALALHARLAASRPAPSRLTEFYLWMSLGGALGGAFTALAVPVLFDTARDYVMMVVIGCFFRPSISAASRLLRVEPRTLTLAFLPAILLVIVSRYDLEEIMIWRISVQWIASIVAAGFALAFARRAIPFGLSIAAIVVAAIFLQSSAGTLYRDRSFFGIYRVGRAIGPAHVLFHGTTIHGAQFTDPARRLIPITYYHPNGPVGQVFRSLEVTGAARKIGVVGLGTGSILCYSNAGEDWTFFEIDPEIEAIARNRRFFSYLEDCEVEPRIVLGDARLTLEREAAGEYSLLVLDAFTSDAIPVHLLTREAIALYQRVLADDGILLIHVSNRRLDLEPVVGDLAADAGLVALVQNHDVAESVQDEEYDYGSDWVIMARRPEHLGSLAADTLWQVLPVSKRGRPWSDDYSNLLRVIRWK